MPKIRTHQGTAKRIHKTGSGKLKRRYSFGNHFLSKKSSARKRPYTKRHDLNSAQEKTVKRNLGE